MTHARITDDDVTLLAAGSHYRLYEKLGAHPATVEGTEGTHFAVWAPTARSVALVGDFNDWNAEATALAPRSSGGIWEAFVPDVGQGELYKLEIAPKAGGRGLVRSDPFGFRHQQPPKTASIVWNLDFAWQDHEWCGSRRRRPCPPSAMSIYAMHFGSWIGPTTYREAAPRLVDHVEKLGFTHVLLLPVMEHPFLGSWGYQTTGYFAPTSRYGSPQDLMCLVDLLHRRGIGVILDWVPSCFPSDEHGLARFDGTALFERSSVQLESAELLFDARCPEVRSFLISSALFWLDRYHVDGLRAAGVGSLLWAHGPGGDRSEADDVAVSFLRDVNTAIADHFPHAVTIADNAACLPEADLGFALTCDRAWSRRTLDYFGRERSARPRANGLMPLPGGSPPDGRERILPFGHDDVSRGKSSLIARIPGDEWQRFAGLRLLFAYQFAVPGKKLLFMGAELGQINEWSHDFCLEWGLLEYPMHRVFGDLLRQLNHIYVEEPALWGRDRPGRLEWVVQDGSDGAVHVLERAGGGDARPILVAFNFSSAPLHGHRVGVERGGFWEEIVNTDAVELGGSGQGNLGGKRAEPVAAHGKPYSLELTLPPLAAVYMRPE